MRTSWSIAGVCLLVLAACSEEQVSPPAEQSPDGAFATDTSAPSVTLGGGRTLRSWEPPELEIAEKKIAATRAEAAQALQEGRLFGEPRDAIALYLELREQLPDDPEVREGLAKALQALLEQGEATLAKIDRDPAQWRRAHEIAAVARAIDPDAEAVQGYLEQLDGYDRVHELLVAGERALAAGRAGARNDGSDGALAYFRQALELRPENQRARQGLLAVEDTLIQRAEQAARESNFQDAERWLDSADQVREQGDDVAAARKLVGDIRAARIWQLRDLGIAALARRGGLAEARRKLDTLLRIAESGNPAASELRKRIDLAAHYGLYRPGQVFTDALQGLGRGPVMVVVPHGGFRMGAAEDEQGARDVERPQHYVRFDRGFAMSRNEITVGQFRRFIQASGYETRARRRGFSTVYDEQRGNLVKRSGVDWRHDYAGELADTDMPVVHVSARDAEAYAQWLSAQTGARYRLPSEAEFEYALRAGSQGRFPWGGGVPPPGTGNFTGARDQSPSGRNWRNAFAGYGDGYWGPAPVGSFSANAYGLHDLAGNVSEWVADCWHEGYRRAPVDGRAWINPGCRTRVLRGGSWASGPDQTRSAWRLRADADTTNARLGFRVVRDI